MILKNRFLRGNEAGHHHHLQRKKLLTVDKSDLSAFCMDLKFSAHTYFRTRNSNLSSTFYKNERLFLVIVQ